MLLLAASAGVVCSSIVIPFYSVGALVVPVTEEFGWTRAEFQLVLLFSTGTGVLTAPVVGWLVDRFGARPIALSGLVGLSLALVLPAFAEELWMFYAAYTMIALLGAGTIPVTWTRAVTATFVQQRGLALGLTLSGTGICGILIPQYTVWLVTEFGWRTAYLGLAALPVLFAVPLVYLFFNPGTASESNEGTGGQWGLSLGEAARGYRFWVLLASIFLVYVAMSGMLPNLIPALADRGMSPGEAATAASVVGFMVIAGRLIVGYLVDHWWAPAVGAVAIAMPAAGSLILLGEPGLFLACVAAGLLGFAAGAELDLMAYLVARYFGLRQYAKIYGIMYAALALASGLAPSVFAMAFDLTGSYDTGFVVGAGLFVTSSIFILLLGPYPVAGEQRVNRR